MSNNSDGFCQLLGKVFYCSAMADKVIKAEEISKLNELIEAHWKEDGKAILAAFYSCVNLGFDTEQLWIEIAAEKVVDAVLFSHEMVEKIMKTAYKIAASFASTNKSEVVFISQLRIALEK